MKTTHIVNRPARAKPGKALLLTMGLLLFGSIGLACTIWYPCCECLTDVPPGCQEVIVHSPNSACPLKKECCVGGVLCGGCGGANGPGGGAALNILGGGFGASVYVTPMYMSEFKGPAFTMVLEYLSKDTRSRTTRTWRAGYKWSHPYERGVILDS